MSVDTGGGEPPGNPPTELLGILSCIEAMDVVNNKEIGTFPGNENTGIGNNNDNTSTKRGNDNILNNMPPNKIPNLTPRPNPQPLNDRPLNTNDSINSVKNTYEVNKNNRFHVNDIGPFCILIESENKNIGRMHPMSLGKLLYEQVNFNRNINNIAPSGINQIRVEFSSYESVNQLLDSNFLKNNQLRAYIPETILYRKGVIRNVDISLNNEEIMNVIESNVRITEVRRILRTNIVNGERQTSNTETVVLTFRGQTLPQSIVIYGAKCKVNPYIYKVRQCVKCLRFGHNKFTCRSKPRCNNCGENHISTECNNPNHILNCLNCTGSHQTVNLKECPVFENQKLIKKYMAVNNVGYIEAKNKYRNYSEVASNSVNLEKNNFPDLATTNRFHLLRAHQDLEDQQESATIPNIMRRPRRPVNIYSSTEQVQPSTSRNIQQGTVSQSRENNSILNPYPPQPHLLTRNNKTQNMPTRYVSDESVSLICSKIMQLIEQSKDNNLSISQLRDCFTEIL